MRTQTRWAITIAVAIIGAVYVYYNSTENAPAQARVRVRGEKGYVDVVIDSPDVLEDAVLKPIRTATPEPVPAAYVHFGELIVRDARGAETTYTLYLPWGRFSTGRDYFETDLSRLKGFTYESVAEAQRHLDVARMVPE